MKINSFWLKILAVIIMVIDHIGHYFITDMSLYFYFRFLGRLAFPIFCFTFVEGFIHTSNKNKYIKRLGIAAIVMFIINVILSCFGVNISAFSPNIFATFFAMAIVLDSIKQLHNKISLLPILSAILGVLLVALYLEYSFHAVFIILCFYLLHDKAKLKLIIYVIGSIILCLLSLNIIQLGMIFAAIPLLFYTSEKPKYKMKNFFYVFYPLHIWLFAFIQMLMV